MLDFSLQQAKHERQTSNDQASAPVANDGNDDGENGNGKQRGNRLPRATKMSDATATNNGGDGGCGDRDGGDGAWGWLLEKGMNEGKRQRRAQRGRQQGNFTAPLELRQDRTRAGTVHVGTSDENESGAFATRRTVMISIQNCNRVLQGMSLLTTTSAYDPIYSRDRTDTM